MNMLLRFIISITMMIVVGCGIKGQPLSPSEVRSLGQKESLFPLNDTGDKACNTNDTHRKKSYASIAQLEQVGYDYNANFGLENNNLDDVLERIKPKSALIKKRVIIPLRYGYE